MTGRTTRGSEASKRKYKGKHEDEHEGEHEGEHEDEEKEEEKEDKPKQTKSRGRPPKKKQEHEEEAAGSEEEERGEREEGDEPAPEAHVIGEIDSHFEHSGHAKVVVGDKGRPYDAMLVFKEGKSDKYYLLQVIEDKKEFTCYSRSGRRRTKGRTHANGPTDQESAVDDFEKKFHEKTGNDWNQFVEGKFEHKKKKYECVETES